MSKPNLKKLESIISTDIKSNFEEQSKFIEENEERLRAEFIEKVKKISSENLDSDIAKKVNDNFLDLI